jgi:hypothetical protein
MAADVERPGLGFATFALLKVAGYTAFCHLVLSKRYGPPTKPVVVVGLARTGIGVAAGALYTALFGAAGFVMDTVAGGRGALVPVFLLGLVPVRILEWRLLIWLFYDRQNAKPHLLKRAITHGIAASFALDVPTITGLITAGGLWIC